MATASAWSQSQARRLRSGALLLLAAIVLTLAAAAIHDISRGSGLWRRFQSCSGLMAVMRDSPPHNPAAMDAWTELWRRHADNRLSTADRSRLIDQCLLSQAAGPAAQVGGEIEFLADCCEKDRMTATQQGTFLRQLVSLNLRVRPRVSLGDDVPFVVTFAGNMLGTYQFRLVSAKVVSAKQTLTEWPELLKTNDPYASASGNFPCTAPGRDEVTLRGTGEIWKPGVDADGQAGFVRCHGWPISLSGAFEVVPADAGGGITIIDNPGMQAPLRRQIQPKELRYVADKVDSEAAFIDGRLTGLLDAGGLPVGVAFDVFARAHGKEYPLGRLCRARGLQHFEQPLTCPYTGPRMFAVDIVLRANPPLARRTVDLTEAWQGELVFRNVPVRILGAAADPENWD